MLRTLARSEIVAEPLLARSQPIPINDCPELEEVFGDHKALAVRRSRLRNSAGMIVSENLITYRRVDREALIPLGDQPFGLHVRERGMFERRRIFRTGVTLATFGALPADSAGRVYEISFSTGQSVLVHEVFAPDLLPTREGRTVSPIAQPAQPETSAGRELVPQSPTPVGATKLVVPQ
ncbi:hypothetical protein [Nocardia sp. NPDC049149]|uniref:hypothetical protein n=1 Tax=Nocardia sp. NPDC049149 TaxID=3364315 RepID=UPI003712267C